MARVITSEPFSGWRTCGRPRVQDEQYGDAVQETDCPDYLESAPATIVRETTEWTFAALGAKAAESAGMDVNNIERSAVRYLPVNAEDPESWRCESCGFEMCDFSPEPRPTYRRVSESPPDELRKRSLRQDRQAEAALTLQERQTAALEAMAKQGEAGARIAELEAQLAALTQRLTVSEPEDDPVDPPKRRTAPRAA